MGKSRDDAQINALRPNLTRLDWNIFQVKYGQSPGRMVFVQGLVLNLRTEQTKKGVILIEI